MEDHNIGIHCKVSTCNQKDWLPIKCKYCKQIFCADHSTIQSHDCPQYAKQYKKVYTCPLCNKNIEINPNLSVDQNFNIHQAMNCQKNFQQNVKIEQYCHQNKCKAKLTELNRHVCKRCRMKFCLKHRMEQVHLCFS